MFKLGLFVAVVGLIAITWKAKAWGGTACFIIVLLFLTLDALFGY